MGTVRAWRAHGWSCLPLLLLVLVIEMMKTYDDSSEPAESERTVGVSSRDLIVRVKICSQHMAWTEPNYELRCEQPYWNARTRVESCDWSSTVLVSLQPIESWRWRLWRMNESRRSCNWVDLLQDGSVQFTYCEQSSMDTANSRAVARQIDLRYWDLRDFVNESAHAAADANSRRSSTRMYDTWPQCD